MNYGKSNKEGNISCTAMKNFQDVLVSEKKIQLQNYRYSSVPLM